MNRLILLAVILFASCVASLGARSRPKPKINAAIHSISGDITIPRILHQPAKIDPRLEPVRATWKALHKEWKIRLWTEAAMEKLVREHYPWALAAYQHLPIGPARRDVARFLLVHKFGGVYTEPDIEPVKPIDALLGGKTVVVSLIGHEKEDVHPIPNSFFASVPGHPFWLFCAVDALTRARVRGLAAGLSDTSALADTSVLTIDRVLAMMKNVQEADTIDVTAGGATADIDSLLLDGESEHAIGQVPLHRQPKGVTHAKPDRKAALRGKRNAGPVTRSSQSSGSRKGAKALTDGASSRKRKDIHTIRTGVIKAVPEPYMAGPSAQAPSATAESAPVFKEVMHASPVGDDVQARAPEKSIALGKSKLTAALKISDLDSENVKRMIISSAIDEEVRGDLAGAYATYLQYYPNDRDVTVLPASFVFPVQPLRRFEVPAVHVAEACTFESRTFSRKACKEFFPDAFAVSYWAPRK